MSHRVTIPILVDDLQPTRAQIEPKSLRAYGKNPETANFRFSDEAGMAKRSERAEIAINAWHLRDRFLSWPMEDWRGFFEISGKWDVGGIGEYFTKDDFAEWQRLLRAALTIQARDWESLSDEFDPRKLVLLKIPARVVFEWRETVPVARVGRGDALSLMIATIQVDKIQGAEFRECARDDCKNPPFRVGAHQKIHCGPDCAHLAAVRRYRDRKRATQRAGRK